MGGNEVIELGDAGSSRITRLGYPAIASLRRCDMNKCIVPLAFLAAVLTVGTLANAGATSVLLQTEI